MTDPTMGQLLDGYRPDLPPDDYEPEHVQEQSPEPSRRSWAAQDLAAVLDGTYKPPQPSVGTRDDGIGLFYPGRVNSVASESEAGKTWLALVACLQEINAGRHVVYVDFEDDAGGVVGRLLALGAIPDTVRGYFHYVRPESRPTDIDLLDLKMVLQQRPALAVIDGVTEAMSMFGLELKDNTDIAKFGQLLLRPLTACGAAVVTLDHVVKSSEHRGRYSLGGVHKLNGLNGVGYVLENVRPFGIGVTGKSIVRIAKDRPAQLRRHALPHASGLHWFADLVIVSHDVQHSEAHLYAPGPRAESARHETTDADRIGPLQDRILAALRKAAKPLSGREVEDRVTGKAADKRMALAYLVDDDRVLLENGPRGAKMHRLPAAPDTPI